MTSWDPTSAKALLRLTIQRLGQLQEKKDSRGQIIRRDIATLLQQGNVGLARAKAQNLIHDDIVTDLLEVLEMYLGVILEHFGELEQRLPSPILTEAAASIIFAAPRAESKDLDMVKDMLIHRLGADFGRSAMSNRDDHVSLRITRLLSAPPLSAANLDDYIAKIAKMYGIKWTPEPQRQDIVDAVSEILAPESSALVDLPRLRKLCSQGLPDEPSWLRPRVWKLFFGMLPVLKASWEKEIRTQRDSYYDLVRRLLAPFSSLPSPSKPFTSLDASLMRVSETLSHIPPSLFLSLKSEPESSSSCPLDETAEKNIRIPFAQVLDTRLEAIRKIDFEMSGIPEIHLEEEGNAEGSIEPPKSFAGRRARAPATLMVSANGSDIADAHPKHTSALVRILYIHSCLNPANQSPHIPSLLVPLYSTLIQEVDPQEAAHAEADTFWLFEAVVGEFSELEDEEGGQLWMKKFSERLTWADAELAENLHGKGLDPALPHYSYRWLAPILTHTLPLSSIFPIWDVLFSCPMRSRDSNSKLDYLLDICTSMLIRARIPLFRLGKPDQKSPGLWNDDAARLPPPSPLRPWQLSDAFREGMSLLQLYPVEAAGGIDLVLQTASDLAHRREEEKKKRKTEKLSLGSRLTMSMWKGFTNQVTTSDESSPEEEEEEGRAESVQDSPDDGNETDKPTVPGLTSRLANSVWKGITNQSSMDVPSTPPLSPNPSPSPLRSPPLSPPSPPSGTHSRSSSQASTTIWNYAGKLKDSDAAATLAKVSSNWRAKAMEAWSMRHKGDPPSETGFSSPASTTSELPPKTDTSSLSSRGTLKTIDENRRGSLPPVDRSRAYSPPPRPPHFRPPRDSFMPQPRRGEPTSPASPALSTQSDNSFIHRTKASMGSFAAFQARLSQPSQRTTFRPLVLNSQSLVTTPAYPAPAKSESSVSEHGQWSDVLRAGHAQHVSGSSISSSSRTGMDRELDTTSRIVPLNRKSVSPLAPASRASLDAGLSSPFIRPKPISQHDAHSHSDTQSERGWRNIDPPESPATIPSPPVPPTPIILTSSEYNTVYVSNSEHQRGSMTFSESSMEPHQQARKIVRKRTPPPPSLGEADDATDSSVSQTPSKSPRLRSKRYPQRPTLRIRDPSRPSAQVEQRTPSPNTLTVEWPEDLELAATPRASTFNSTGPSSSSPRSPHRSRKISNDGHETRQRKVSTDGTSSRTRKVSTGSRERRRARDSAAEEGDDEGYDDLLSAYESEDGNQKPSPSTSNKIPAGYF